MNPSTQYDPFWMPQVTLPVRRVGDAWEFFYGGEVPVVQGTMGELRILTSSITDETFRNLVTRETLTKVLSEDATLYAALSDRSRGGARIESEQWPNVHSQDVPLGTTRFAPVILGSLKLPRPGAPEFVGPPSPGGLWLRVRGLERTEIVCGIAKLPAGMPQAEAISLNHAFTELSKHFERHRISNTGSIYTRFFYPETNGTWYPLEHLRAGVRASVERSLLEDAWSKIEAELGWCRLEETKQKDGRRRGRRA